MALSYGKSHLNCPNCREKNKFCEEALNQGVYIPEKDAEWENPNQEEFYNFQAMGELYNSCDANPCACTKGPKFNLAGSRFEVIFSEFLEQHKNERCIVLGDFNFDPDRTNALTRKFKEWNFTQQVSNPTHRDGNIIDHIYVSEELLEHSVCDLHYVYYSDHQGVCITLKNPPEC